MIQINEHHSFVGMQRDIDISKYPSQYLYDARNIRLTSREDNTLLSITNEKGTKETNIFVEGQYLGHCLLNQYLIVFSKDVNTKEQDYISRIDLKELYLKVLYNGNLNFSLEHPIEAISSYENENIQKVYWTDGYNQPRIINIVADTSKYKDDYFDFVRNLTLNEKVTIHKLLGSGRFAPGVIQYAFTYYTKYGQESNIFYISPLQYISFQDRGASPEEMVENAFRIKVENVDDNFDYLRIYSIHRTSIDGEPIVKRVQDINLKSYSSDYLVVPSVISSTEPPLIGQPVQEFKTLLNHEMFWFGYSKKEYPYLYLYTSAGYVTWGPDTSDDSYIWVSSSRVANTDTNTNDYIICCTSNLSGDILQNMRLSTNSSLSNGVSFIDTGNIGSSVDPTELLYKGGESVIAQTLEQKDNTLFLGNLTLKRPQIEAPFRKLLTDREKGIKIVDSTRKIYPLVTSTMKYKYANQLNSTDGNNNSVPCGGFKKGDYYRCGVQFQYKDGKWSDPIFIEDKQIENRAQSDDTSVTLATLDATIPEEQTTVLTKMGYRKARAVVVYPGILDRMTYCQGVVCPTLYTKKHREEGDLYAQSSWFFRPSLGNNLTPVLPVDAFHPDGTISPVKGENGTPLYYTNKEIAGSNCFIPYKSDNSSNIRQTEIQGEFNNDDKFRIEDELCTLHSPDIEFDDYLQVVHLTNTAIRQVGKINFTKTFSDIDIQTESPTISNNGSGFVHKSFAENHSYGIVAGLFYDDYIVDDKYESETNKYHAYNRIYSPSKWLVYPWNKSGSLNNDVNRPAGDGTRTAMLKKKVLSNLRYADTIWSDGDSSGSTGGNALNTVPQMFISNEVSILKFGDKIYQGNIDTLLSPDNMDGMYFTYDGNLSEDGSKFIGPSISADFSSNNWWKTFGIEKNDADSNYKIDNQGLYKFSNYLWEYKDSKVGNDSKDLALSKDSVRMKYKSTPHMVFAYPRVAGESYGLDWSATDKQSALPIIEIVRKEAKPANLFGGESEDALKANVWIPCGEPVILGESFDGTATQGETVFEYSWGDTYYQRYDCLKTYPFTPEDINQIVEIGSFMLETHINIDGRYDRNRGQLNNLNMTPQNFNLINPVYSQTNNFFTYRILDDDYYNINTFPNQITWSKEKQAGADTDLWTNITLGSTYDMDGSKGEVISLNTWKDQIFCFQNKGVSNILFNSRVQIPVSDGLPIEITNSYKVDGYRYIADGIGCNNKFQIKEAPSGVYFIDSVSNYLFKISDGLQDISTACNMTSWFKDEKNAIDRLIYDEVNHDLYLVNEKEALCFSEVLGQFSSFMDYGKLSLLESYNNRVFGLYHKVDEKNNFDFTALYEMFAGRYNDFFGRYLQLDGTQIMEYPNYRPWYFTFISNGIANQQVDFDKVFGNLDYRMDMLQDGNYQHQNSLDYIRVFNEYQDTGDVPLIRLKNMANPWSWNHKSANLQKKFRIWRIQIPRDKNHKMDRIRNTWCKVTLGRKVLDSQKVVLHDLNVQYYI